MGGDKMPIGAINVIVAGMDGVPKCDVMDGVLFGCLARAERFDRLNKNHRF